MCLHTTRFTIYVLLLHGYAPKRDRGLLGAYFELQVYDYHNNPHSWKSSVTMVIYIYMYIYIYISTYNWNCLPKYPRFKHHCFPIWPTAPRGKSLWRLIAAIAVTPATRFRFQLPSTFSQILGVAMSHQRIYECQTRLIKNCMFVILYGTACISPDLPMC